MWVLVGDGIDSFGPEYAWLLHHLIENADVVLFVTREELPVLRTFLTSPGDLPHTTMIDQCVFPRLHFCTLSSAMGQPLEAGEVVMPELAFGRADPLAGVLFEGNRFFFHRADGSPITRHVLPAADAAGGSIVLARKVLERLLEKTLVQDPDAFFSKDQAFLESAGLDARQIEEASSNVEELINEIARFERMPNMCM